MLDDRGLPYLDANHQKLRKAKLVLQSVWGIPEN
jgi:hypothetical protein